MAHHYQNSHSLRDPSDNLSMYLPGGSLRRCGRVTVAFGKIEKLLFMPTVQQVKIVS